MKKTNIKNNLILLFVTCLFAVCFSCVVNFINEGLINKTSTCYAESIVTEEPIVEQSNINNVLRAGEAGITSITAEDRDYDGTNVIELDITSEDITDVDTSIIGTGTVSSADVGTGKLVTVDISSLEIIGGHKDDYTLNTTLPAGSISVNITKLSVTFSWNIVGGSNTFAYTGSSLYSKIRPFYVDVNNVSQEVNYSIVGNSYAGMGYSPNDFINPGIYTATIVTAEKDKNYTLLDDASSTSKSFYISRRTPVISCSKSNFVYTGELQDVSAFVSVNNNEQTLYFSACTFTTYDEGVALINNVQASVLQTENYEAETLIIPMTVEKADSIVSLSALPISYVYNGQIQTLNKNLIDINNTEQEISIIVQGENDFRNVGNYTFTIQANESRNYKANINDDFQASITKKQINVSQFSWSATRVFNYEIGRTYEVSLITNNNPDVTPVLSGTYRATTAGNYVAKVERYLLTDSANCETIGSTPDLLWSVNKWVQTIPTLSSVTTFTYNGEEKEVVFNIMSNSYFRITNNTATNAGDYTLQLVLIDAENAQWSDGSQGAIYVNYKINKAVLQAPQISGDLFYTGSEQNMPIATSGEYSILQGKATEIGTYTSFLVLKDSSNYKWADSEDNYISVTWKILEQPGYQPVPVASIIIGVVLVLVFGIYLTLHFTIVAKIKRKKKLQKIN